MTSTNNPSRNRSGPPALIEPDLAAWAEKITIGSTNDRRGLWYGALVFWLVVACIIAARVAFLDPGGIRPATATSAIPPVLAGSAPDVIHDAEL